MSDSPNGTFDLGANYFSLFSLPVAFDIDLKSLKASYLGLQQGCHPDKFAGAEEAQQREAVQRTAYLNQAHEALKSPLKRAIYMLHLQSVDFDPDSEMHTDVDFLMAQLEQREKLEAVNQADDPFAALEQLEFEAKQEYSAFQQEFVSNYSDKNWDAAIKSVHKMMFAHKLLTEIHQKEEALES